MQEIIERKYLFYRFFTNLWFVGAVWLYFYRLFITDQQIGLLDGMAFAIGLLAEIPTGALADKFGRSNLVRLGQILAGSGLLIQAIGGNFLQFFVGQSVMMVGISFCSGADEALFFQKLNYDRNSLHWRKLVTRGGQVALLAAITALITGGFLQQINPRIPWILNGFTFILASLVIWQVKDTRVKAVEQGFAKEIKDYLSNIFKGVKEFASPNLSLYIPLIITIQGLFYASGWGILRLILLSRFGFSPLLGAFAIASCSLLSIGLLGLMHKKAEKFSEKRVLVFIAVTSIISLLAAVANVGLLGYFVILVLYAGEQMLYPFMSEIINNRAPEAHRATVLSVAAFLRTLPYVVLAPIIGYLNTNHHLEYFLVIWPILIVLAIIIYLLRKRSDIKLTLPVEN
jgi:MFS family permease